MMAKKERDKKDDDFMAWYNKESQFIIDRFITLPLIQEAIEIEHLEYQEYQKKKKKGSKKPEDIGGWRESYARQIMFIPDRTLDELVNIINTERKRRGYK